MDSGAKLYQSTEPRKIAMIATNAKIAIVEQKVIRIGALVSAAKFIKLCFTV